jgi:hypothetical protein
MSKANRKSPRLRVALSSGVGAPAFLSLGAEAWKLIECAYGKNLLQEADRIVIDRIVNSYLRWQPLERSAPFKSDVERTLSGIQQRLRAALILLDTSSTGLVAEAYLAKPGKNEKDFSQKLIDLMNDCRFASTRVRNGPGFVEGSAWRKMIRDLSEYLDRRGLPVAASKGQGKARAPKASPFVRLVRELQRAFPDGFSRHNHSYEALAKAIGDARRRHRAGVPAPGPRSK